MKILTNGYREKKNKKILYGGTRNFTSILKHEMGARGHSIISFNVHGKKQVDDKFKFTQEVKGKHPAWFLKLRLNLKGIYEAKSIQYPSSTKRPIEIIAAAIKKLNPDVVLLNGYSTINWYIMRAAKLAGYPVVVVHHGLWFKEFENVRDAGNKQILREMEKDVTRFADRQVFLNEFSRQEFEKNLIKTNPKKTYILPLPFNPIFAQGRGETKKLSGLTSVGMVSRWDPVKAPEQYLFIAREAKKQQLPLKFSAVLKIRHYYKNIDKYKIDFKKYIRVIPQLTSAELKNYYEQMDIMINPSNFDVSPTVVMEAALCGTPTVISPNVGWTYLYKKLGMKDWIVDFKDTQKALKKIEKLIAQKNTAIKFASYVRKNHNVKTVFDKYDKFLKKIIKVNR